MAELAPDIIEAFGGVADLGVEGCGVLSDCSEVLELVDEGLEREAELLLGGLGDWQGELLLGGQGADNDACEG